MRAIERLLAMSALLIAMAQPALSQIFAGGWEGEAETDRWPIFLSVQLAGADAALTGKLFVLGQTVDLPVLRIDGDAFTFATATTADALVLEGKRVEGKLVGHLKQNGETFPFTFRRVPDYPKAANRVEAWSQDLDALEQRFLAVDRSFSPAERAGFVEAIASIREELPRLDDAQVTVRIASAIALAKNAHTRLYLLRNRTELRRLPIRLWWFSDGLRVVRATTDQKVLLGCRVDAIAGLDVRQARDFVASAYAGNSSWRDYMSVYSLTSPEMLHGFGITDDPEHVPMTFSDCAARSADLTPMPLVKSKSALEAWWDLSPDYPQGEQWVHVLAGAKLPLYLHNPKQFYWFQALPDGTFYFQFNRAADMPDEDTKTFAKKLLAAFDAAKPKAFVIDLRFNTGGNGDLGRDLMKELDARTKGMPRFAITGRATFSAGLAYAAWWRGADNVTIVGEPVGDEMDFWSEGGNIILPNSGLAAHFANGAHSYSMAPCPPGVKCLDMNVPSLRPDVPALLSWWEYVAGADPAMGAITASLERRPLARSKSAGEPPADRRPAAGATKLRV
jgi:hypothetical protein